MNLFEKRGMGAHLATPPLTHCQSVGLCPEEVALMLTSELCPQLYPDPAHFNDIILGLEGEVPEIDFCALADRAMEQASSSNSNSDTFIIRDTKRKKMNKADLKRGFHL